MTTDEKTFTAEYQLRGCAQNCDPNLEMTILNTHGTGTYERAANLEIAVCLNVCVSHGFFDMAHGAVDEPGGYQALWGRWILKQDEHGFITYDEFNFDQDAEAEFVRRFEDEPATYSPGNP